MAFIIIVTKINVINKLNKGFMLQILIVVFREVLEIAIIVGILTAATKGIPNRARYILAGMALGVCGSLALALAMDEISSMLDGRGQEIFNGVILICAAILISWTVIWMQQHARSLSGEIKNLANSVKEGQKSMISLLIVVFLSILREGSEITLFSYGYYLTGMTVSNIILGLVLGLILGTACGVALYFGMLKIFGRYFFKVTTWVLVFLACAICSKGVYYLVNAEVLPVIIEKVWDSSLILSQKSTFGNLLHIFIGYADRPTGMEVIAYILNFTILATGLNISNNKLNSRKS